MDWEQKQIAAIEEFKNAIVHRVMMSPQELEKEDRDKALGKIMSGEYVLVDKHFYETYILPAGRILA